ncbi:MAG: cation:proton antiporter, partial [Candidatus Peribacteraceae bacterium]|nr:cation:proton antiporter [Candidatus Peribacteraceae bacterium]
IGIVRAQHELEIFSQMGVSFLLFIVGLSLNPRIVRDVGRVSVLTGIGQVLFTSGIGYIIAIALGFDRVTSGYLAIALTFSSTIIIMKLLSDKGELESLYGRIATGFLIVQDIVAMLLLIAITSVGGGDSLGSILQTTLLQLTGLLVLLVAFGIYVLPRLLKTVAASQELLLLFSIAWCLAVAAFFQEFGLSMEMGALAAGVVLSLSPYRYEVAAKLRPLRDFFVVLFFVLLGSQMVFTNFSAQILPILLFSAFILLGNPLIVLIIMGALGYSKRNSFRAGLTVAQISEFSFILIAVGIRVGHVSADILSLVTFVGILTIAVSTYFILYADALYKLLERPLSLFERRGPKVDRHRQSPHNDHDILLLGYERVGLNVVEALRRTAKTFLVIDFNPVTIASLKEQQIPCLYGDLGDSEFLNEINFAGAKMVVSTIRDFTTSVLTVRRVRSLNKKAIVVVLAQQVDEALYLYEIGASYVITPQFLSGYHTSLLIQEYGCDMQKFILEKTRHIEHLKHLIGRQ